MATTIASTARSGVALGLQKQTDWKGAIFKATLLGSLLFALLILVVLLQTVITDGWSVLSTRFGDFLGGRLRSDPEDAGIGQGLRGTLWLSLITAVVAFPLGIGAAIYLEEYASKTSRLARIIDLNIRNLAGVPSVVYGILGLTIFVRGLGPLTGGSTPIAAGLTLAALVLPVVIITSAEAIRSTPQPSP